MLDPARAEALATVLGLNWSGGDLPPFFHQIYFWEAAPASDLGRDGHPRTGGFIPDLGLPRRMWAGGRLRFLAPLRVGSLAERQSEILSVTQKVGRSGPLGFVTLRHRIVQGGRVLIEEEQDLVYRPEADPAAPAPRPRPAPPDASPTRLTFDATALFRYSALTFNGHRIHYDADYARSAEGYAGLVVHGPLLAQFLMLHAADVGPLTGFSFRGLRPLTVAETAIANRSGGKLWIRTETGAMIMEADATWDE